MTLVSAVEGWQTWQCDECDRRIRMKQFAGARLELETLVRGDDVPHNGSTHDGLSIGVET